MTELFVYPSEPVINWHLFMYVYLGELIVCVPMTKEQIFSRYSCICSRNRRRMLLVLCCLIIKLSVRTLSRTLLLLFKCSAITNIPWQGWHVKVIPREQRETIWFHATLFCCLCTQSGNTCLAPLSVYALANISRSLRLHLKWRIHLENSNVHVPYMFVYRFRREHPNSRVP